MTHLDPHLLAAVCADPADDGARLAASDWLEEHGEAERAEFVRVQVELAQRFGVPADGSPVVTGCRTVDAGENRLRRRERELLSGVQDGTKEALCGQEDCWIEAWEFRRGFVASLASTAADFLRHADALLWHPGQDRPCQPTAQPIEAVTLTTWPEVLISLPDDGMVVAQIRGPHRPRRYGGAVHHNYIALDLLHGEWPQVTFRPPPSIHVVAPAEPWSPFSGQ